METIIIGVIAISLAIYSMISIAMGHMEKKRKMLWFAFVVLVPIVGPMIYYVVKPKR